MNGFPMGKSVWADSRLLHVELLDGRVISTPLEWYPILFAAAIRDIQHYQFICDATGIEWPTLDYHLSIESMLQAKPLREAA
jgi:DNA-binding transcriptional ArsR family regulator